MWILIYLLYVVVTDRFVAETHRWCHWQDWSCTGKNVFNVYYLEVAVLVVVGNKNVFITEDFCVFVEFMHPCLQTVCRRKNKQHTFFHKFQEQIFVLTDVVINIHISCALLLGLPPPLMCMSSSSSSSFQGLDRWPVAALQCPSLSWTSHISCTFEIMLKDNLWNS